ncbi:MAG: TIGR01777 family oxidoreductase [Proteobacteria bacterium]|nr:TIGR01777 family oxidoreductase [Pseudomonadota bacterium]MBU1687571.1 TIGR01777 family oxidoreductase [Pseudomonadota bacterium]
MKILLSGASGLVGTALTEYFEGNGHQVLSLKRTDDPAITPRWNPSRGVIELGSGPPFEVVINLAGDSIAKGRWTPTKKDRIRSSRVMGTRLLAECLAGLAEKPRLMISTSAVGFYGSRADEILTEASSTGSGFLAGVCREWEQATGPAAEAGIRVVLARFGMVLSAQGGSLTTMVTPFRMGLGGIIGNGRQFMSWITIDDLVAIMGFLVDHPELSGPVNVVAPTPVTNREFTRTLGRILCRPTLLPLPGLVARLVFGEMADELLLASCRVIPARLQKAGYEFIHPNLTPALTDLLP